MIWNKETAIRILTNPFYCLPKIHETFGVAHKPIMFEDDFITGAEMLIKEIGAREYLRYLLENLKGNDISADNGIVTAKRYLSSDE